MEKYRRCLAVLLASVLLCGGTVQAADMTDSADTSEMDQDVFDGWSEENREAAVTSFEMTDWESLGDQLVFDGIVTDGMQVKNLSKKVEALEPTVKEVLKKCRSKTGTPAWKYTALILASIEALTGGNPLVDDPCCVKTYFLPDALLGSAESSVRFLFARLQNMEEAYNGTHKKKTSLTKKNDGIQVAVEGLMLREAYVKETDMYTKEHADEYYKANKETVFDPLEIVPVTDFASKVFQHLTMVESVTSTTNTWNGKATSAMQKVCDAARNGKSTRAAKSGYCAAWVSGVYQYALGYYPGGNAIDYWRSWSSSGSRDSGNIPPAAAVVGTGSGTRYGHVGIYVGNGEVAENIGGYRVVSLERWITWQNAKPSKISGEKGWIGWVWPCKKDLSKS